MQVSLMDSVTTMATARRPYRYNTGTRGRSESA